VKLTEELERRLRFGMKPGLETMKAACAALGHPEKSLEGVIHVAGTNGKGAICAMLDACLRAGGARVGRYTSPHLVSVNERFFLDGAAVALSALDEIVEDGGEGGVVGGVLREELTYFEFLTLVAFILYAREKPDFTILETGLGGRLDATNVCVPALTIISRIGLDHCDWLGDTVEKVAAEKAGIIKKDVPIVLGANERAVRAVIEARAKEVGAPFFYAPDLATEGDIPDDFSLGGSFNRENAITALAAMKVLAARRASIARSSSDSIQRGLSQVVWPGRFQRIGPFIVDGAHNPPAARALAAALKDAGFGPRSLNLVCGFCGDKDVDATLRILAPFVVRAYTVKTPNPRSLSAEDLAARFAPLGIEATPTTLDAALKSQMHICSEPKPHAPSYGSEQNMHLALIAGSLFLAGEALVALGALPSGSFDPAERLK